MNLAIAIPLFTGVLAALLSAFGLMLSRNAFDRLHFVGSAAVLSSLLIMAIATGITGSSTESILKGILLMLIFVIVNPVLTHATGEAFLRREERIRGNRHNQ